MTVAVRLRDESRVQSKLTYYQACGPVDENHGHWQCCISRTIPELTVEALSPTDYIRDHSTIHHQGSSLGSGMLVCGLAWDGYSR